MTFKHKGLLAVAVFTVALAPVLAFPRLSAHAPTLAPVPGSAPVGRHLPDLSPFLVPLAGITIRRDTGTLAKKFALRAGQASGDYKDGVSAAGNDWQANALAGEGNYEQGVAQSIADKRFGKGIQAAGAAKYVQNASTLGPQRYQTGVANAEGAWARGTQPHLDGMKGLNLPGRGPKGSAANQQRAQLVAVRNREIKLGK